MTKTIKPWTDITFLLRQRQGECTGKGNWLRNLESAQTTLSELMAWYATPGRGIASKRMGIEKRVVFVVEQGPSEVTA